MADSIGVALNGSDMTPQSYEPRMPPKRSEMVAQRIVKDIRMRGLAAGASMSTENELCSTYNVGRSTLREALRILELQGVVEIRPGRGGGPMVATPNSRHLASTLALLMQFSETTFGTVVETRGYIEPVAAALCAEHGNDAVVRALTDSVAQMGVDIDDEPAFLCENHRFHTLISDGAQSPLIGYIANSLDWILDGAPLGVQFSRNDRRAVLRAHEEIAREIAAGRSVEAGDAMRRHLAETARYFNRKFPKVMSKVVTWEMYGI